VHSPQKPSLQKTQFKSEQNVLPGPPPPQLIVNSIDGQCSLAGKFIDQMGPQRNQHHLGPLHITPISFQYSALRTAS